MEYNSNFNKIKNTFDYGDIESLKSKDFRDFIRGQ